MTKRTTRTDKYTDSQATLFMAFDLGAKSWKLGFSTGFGQKARIRTMDARDFLRLHEEIEAARKRFGLRADAPVVSCYEAGRDGFWLDRYLRKNGIQNIVVDSSSIEVNRRKRRAKSDKLDVDKLLTMLIRYHLGDKKVWRIVRIPSHEEEDQRQPHREMRRWQNSKTEVTNRIRGLLASQGIRPSGVELTDKDIEAMRTGDGMPLQPKLKARLRREVEQLRGIKQNIATLERERNLLLRGDEKSLPVQQMKQLIRLRGVGPASASVLVRELFGWRKFRNRRQLGSLTGYTPTPYNSGSSEREQGISKAGIRHVRSIGVELAWSWLRHQPGSPLTEWFERRFANGGKRARKVGIVAVARRLLIALWKFLEAGVLPDGAALKA